MKQDKIIVGLDSGYPLGKNSRAIPKERLADFLNVDSSNKETIIAFCREYSFIPNDLTHGWQKGFKDLQESIRSLVEKALSNKLSKDDITFINTQIEGIHNKLTIFSDKELHQVNAGLPYQRVDEDTNPINLNAEKESHFVLTKQYPSIQSQIYEELMYFLLGKKKLRNCKFCGKFFFLTRDDRLFCSSECKFNSRDKRRASKNK